MTDARLSDLRRLARAAIDAEADWRGGYFRRDSAYQTHLTTRAIWQDMARPDAILDLLDRLASAERVIRLLTTDDPVGAARRHLTEYPGAKEPTP